MRTLQKPEKDGAQKQFPRWASTVLES